VITPARQQYLRLKAQHPDAVLLYRMGDFYEMFDEDAHTAARVLGIALTSREFGRGGRVPMAGIPYHALNGYLRRFLRAGQRLAICEQMSEPGRGLVEREVVRVLSPGTIDDPALLDQQRPNYLLALARHGMLAGLTWVDVSTGACEYATYPLDEPHAAVTLIQQLNPAEIVAPEGDDLAALGELKLRRVAGDWPLDEVERAYLTRFPNAELPRPAVLRSAGLLMSYLEDGQLSLLRAIEQPLPYSAAGVMVLDRQTRHNLELDLRSRDQHDLFGLLNRTKTAPGARRLRAWLDRPLTERAALERRLDAVAELQADPTLRARLAKALAHVLDLERLATRVATGAIRANELLSLAATLETARRVKALLDGQVHVALLRAAAHEIDALPEACALIEDAIDPEHERTLRLGHDPRVDAILKTIADERARIKELQVAERERTGIRTLKVGYNKVFGYYIEVSRANKLPLPADFERKQTLTNAERYVTSALKEAEQRIAAAEERLAQLESELYAALVGDLTRFVGRMRATCAALSTVDVLNALATVSAEQRYVRPELRDEPLLRVEAGRHPIVERNLPAGAFVPNDAVLDDADGRLVILTGPNMAGKSTYLRQVALIVLLSQIGSFVPAARAEVGIVDRIFTRIGAQDDLARGQSTFMVEMLETATILQHATRQSLVVLDEIGRGTGTADGVAIATAVVEHLAERIGARTLFATHFRELAHLAERLPAVRAMQTAVARHADELVFLHSVVPGVADSAFGLEIARLAGIPEDVLARARAATPVADLPTAAAADVPPVAERAEPAPPTALDLARERLAAELLALDVATTTPLEALNLLADVQRRLRDAASEPIGPRALAAEARQAYERAD
jgi:DNA mismatch repair protein MutS